MELGDALEKLGVGLSRLLRYSFGGFWVILLAAVVNPVDTGKVLKEIPWQLIALSGIVVGAGIYAAHRSLIIPAQHLGLCFILYVGEILGRVRPSDSTSPTRWLGEVIGVPWFRRMLAYTSLRRSDFFPERDREAINVAHAENGLVVMIAEGFAAATLYSLSYPTSSQVAWLPLCLLAVSFLVASYPSAIGQHRLECMRFRARRADVESKLRELGILSVAKIWR